MIIDTPTFSIAICHRQCQAHIDAIWEEMLDEKGQFVDGATRKPQCLYLSGHHEAQKPGILEKIKKLYLQNGD